MNIVNDVNATVQFFVDRRKARKKPAKPVKHSEPSVSFYDTVESCAIGDLSSDVRRAAADVFRALPYEVKHRLAFEPKNGEFCARAQLWSAVLRPHLSQDQHSAAMSAILRQYCYIKAVQREVATV